MSYIFTVEGNIGSGKSSLISVLKQRLNKLNDMPIIYLSEPVSVWENIIDLQGKNIIEKYYENQEKYAFPFQMLAYISKIHQLKEIIKNNKEVIIICERSVYSDKEVFAKMLYDYKKINTIEYSIYLKWFDEFIKDIPITGIIYVNTNPEICEQRIIKRNRKGENMSLEYLENCHDYHELWLHNENIPVLTLNANNDFQNVFPQDWNIMINAFVSNVSLTQISPSLTK